MKKIVLSMILSVILLTGCSESKIEERDNEVKVSVSTVSTGSLFEEGTYIGTVENTESAEIVSQVTGNVKDVKVSVGDTVSAGSVLALFDDTSAKIDLEDAKTGVENAEKSLESAENSLESARVNYDSAMIKSTNDLGAQHELSNHQSEMNLKSIESSATHIGEKIADFKETTLKDAEHDVKKLKKKKKKAKEYGDEEAYQEIKQQLDAAEDALDSANKELRDMEYDYNTKVHDYQTASEELEMNNNEVYAGQQAAALNSIEAAQKSVESAEIGVGSAKVGVESANNKVDAAEYKLSLYTIESPMSGVVEAVYVEKDNYFSAGNVCFVISNPGSRRVVFHVTDNVANEFRSGQDVVVEANGNEYGGKITEVGVATDETGLFQVKAQLQNAEELSNGVGVKLSTIIHRSERKIKVPTDSVYYKDNQAFVYIAKNGKAVKRNVEVDIYGEEESTVLSGLQNGDMVITTWSGALKDGARIKAEKNENFVEEVSQISAGEAAALG
ncbi:MAG: efflux RND transporter periplasmic adaptor subunit [Lachnospiraceae bacterium]|nr:efflux RND transporter periplasmic adaptor subunit [Lachnospiraceae bacterium]